jgi:hypothetical protein
MRHSVRWHLLHLVHNVVAHPLLPLAELFKELRLRAPAHVLYRFHDLTTPPEDAYNKQRYF